MPSSLTFHVNFQTDDGYVEAALCEFRQQHGYGESIRLGDLPVQCMREVLNRAQKLKTEAEQ